MTTPRRRKTGYFLNLMVADRACDTGAPPSDDWNVRVSLTAIPRLCLRALRSAFDAEARGLTVKAMVPAPATAWLPLPKTIFEGRHLPPSRTYPFLHLLVPAANTPNFPFWKVSVQLKVPALLTDALNVIAPVLALTVTPSTVKALLGPGDGVIVG
jgi:hypothetical protein